jgi:hypothetical protein
VPHREIYIGALRLRLRSEPTDLFSFDFAAGGPFPEGQSQLTLVAQGRRVNGLAQWIALDMDDQGRYENHPEPGANSSWMAVFYPFEREIQTTPGQRVTIHARHDRGGLRIWANEE